MSNSFSNNKIEDKQVNNRIKSIDEAKEMILRLIKNDQSKILNRDFSCQKYKKFLMYWLSF